MGNKNKDIFFEAVKLSELYLNNNEALIEDEIDVELMKEFLLEEYGYYELLENEKVGANTLLGKISKIIYDAMDELDNFSKKILKIVLDFIKLIFKILVYGSIGSVALVGARALALAIFSASSLKSLATRYAVKNINEKNEKYYEILLNISSKIDDLVHFIKSIFMKNAKKVDFSKKEIEEISKLLSRRALDIIKISEDLAKGNPTRAKEYRSLFAKKLKNIISNISSIIKVNLIKYQPLLKQRITREVKKEQNPAPKPEPKPTPKPTVMPSLKPQL